MLVSGPVIFHLLHRLLNNNKGGVFSSWVEIYQRLTTIIYLSDNMRNIFFLFNLPSQLPSKTKSEQEQKLQMTAAK
jgi:hypothetical protein